ncbi:uncharacterized protein LOC124927111 isoform X2 [Impatiens glandulifera]|nr:uncharacterized protein LOC124927111 isoform X2 [Impatiens glandulifera]
MLSGTQLSHGGKVKKQLKYDGDYLAPLTPSVVKSSLYSCIDISDNEDQPHGVDVPDESDEDSSGKNEMSLIIKRTPRKRKALNVVYSDGEDDDNSEKLTDDVEDSSEDELRKQTQKRRRRLVSLSNQQHRKYDPEISINESSEDQEEESTTRSDDDNKYASSIPSCSTESREVSDNDDDDVEEYKSNYDWQFEGEMLAVFGKDVKMCMRAVCALYRQQTLDEKTSKGTIYHNGRGFSKFDASR